MHQQQAVYVVDGDHAASGRLASFLSHHGHDAVAFASAAALLAGVRRDRPSCALLDTLLPDRDGIDVLAQLRGRDYGVPVVFVTADERIATCVRAMRAGAIDYLVKPAGGVELLDAVARAHAASARWHASAASHRQARALHARLTAREREVLALVLAGRRNKEIATTLGSQEATIKVHRSRLMHKLGTRTLTELVRFGQLLDAHDDARPADATPARDAVTPIAGTPLGAALS